MTKAEKIRRLQKEFIESAAREVAELRGVLDGSGPEFHGSESGTRLRKIAHDLRGCGAAYGFMALGDNAGKLEDAYRSDAPVATLSELAAALADSIERARAALEQAMAAQDGAQA